MKNVKLSILAGFIALICMINTAQAHLVSFGWKDNGDGTVTLWGEHWHGNLGAPSTANGGITVSAADGSVAPFTAQWVGVQNNTQRTAMVADGTLTGFDTNTGFNGSQGDWMITSPLVLGNGTWNFFTGGNCCIDTMSGPVSVILTGITSVPDGTGPGAATNVAPSISCPVSVTLNEGDATTINVSAFDADAADTVTITQGGVPVFATFSATPGNPAGATVTLNTSFSDSGTYTINFTATDDAGSTDQCSLAVTVVDVNRPPVLNAIGPKVLDEGSTLVFNISGSDPDGDAITFSHSGLPGFASFDPITRDVTLSPIFTDDGVYTPVVFTVTEVGTAVSLSDSETITITVNNVNQAPVLAAIGNQSVNEGDTLTFTVSATDPDTGDTVTLSATNLPGDSTFDPVTGIFSWMPYFDQAGNHTGVLFTATDNGLPVLADSEAITISVGNVNRPPVLAAIGDHSTFEGEPIQFTVTASDPDSDNGGFVFSVDASSLPFGASFNPLTQVFSWTPDLTQAGIYTGIHFEVSDIDIEGDDLTDSEDITITVNVVQPLDIKPGSCPNPINVKSNGKVEVVLLGSVDFDVNQIDLDTLRLNGCAPIKVEIEDETSPEPFPCDCALSDDDSSDDEDSSDGDSDDDNGDSFEDVELKFETTEIIAKLVSTLGELVDDEVITLTLAGTLLPEFNSLDVKAVDCILIKNKPDNGHGNDDDGNDESNPGKGNKGDEDGSEDDDKGHGNDDDGVDDDNPGKSKGEK